MALNKEQWDRLARLSKAWAEAEQSLKISEQQLGDVVIPAIKELRYAGRKLTKALENYRNGVDLPRTDLELEDAIFDCYRARHDATDAATSAISLRLDHAITSLGIEAVKEHFPEYSDLAGLLLTTRRKISMARHDSNGRHDLYEDLEVNELPEIVELYEKFKANEPHMKDRRLSNFLLKQGLNLGWLVALCVAIWAVYYKR